MSIAQIALCLGALFGIWAVIRTRYWYREGKKLQTSGYMTPPSTRLARWTYKAVANIGARILVGPVSVTNRDQCSFEGRGLVLPNHVIYPDFAVIAKTVPFSYRQLAAASQIQNPLFGTLAAWVGTVGVHVEGGKVQDGLGNAVVEAGSAVLKASKGSRLLVFPQGTLVFTGETPAESFRTGATRMVSNTLDAIGDEPFFVLAASIRYRRKRSEATWLQKILYPLGLKLIRTVRYKDILRDGEGKPILDANNKMQWVVPKKMVLYGADVLFTRIPARELPADPRQAIEHIRLRIADGLASLETRAGGKMLIAG